MNKPATPKHPLRYVARATIEFETPFIIGSGEDHIFFDSLFVSDANGLPALPGSSLAGILRHAWEEAGFGPAKDLFGYQEKDQGEGSRLSVSWGCIHDSANRPVEGVVFDRRKLDSDEVLGEARLTTARDHVRIDHRGAAADTGKFDECSVSAGHRFTFELVLDANANDEDADAWRKLLTLLQSDSIRIGGKTRRGYGAFKVISLAGRTFDLRNDADYRAFSDYPVSLAEPATLEDLGRQRPAAAADAVTASLVLEPEGFWMIGGGCDDQADMSPLKASRIVWHDDKGRVETNRAIVPGSAVKGAIAHRVAFHYNRLTQRFAESVTDPATLFGDGNEAVRTLFGYCKDAEGDGQRGRVIISDLFVEDPGEQKVLNHVSIDRFTGGARTLEGALFNEKPFYKGAGFVLKIVVVEPEAVVDKKVRKALGCALEDLAKGRLAIGAGSGRGNGYFLAKDVIQWNEYGKSWVEGGAP